jgi:hypothetical protein
VTPNPSIERTSHKGRFAPFASPLMSNVRAQTPRMHELFVFLAFCGLAYGLFALHSLGFGSSMLDKQIERDAADIEAKSSGKDNHAFLFRIGRPLCWFVTLPLKSPGLALFLAVHMVLPAWIF